jgi:hypothetical protein
MKNNLIIPVTSDSFLQNLNKYYLLNCIKIQTEANSMWDEDSKIFKSKVYIILLAV